MKIEMILIAKGLKVIKVCKSEKEVFLFERDMPAKHGLLYSKKPYVIGKKYIKNESD